MFAFLKSYVPTVLLLMESLCTVSLTAGTLRGQVFVRDVLIPGSDIKVVSDAGRRGHVSTDAEGRFTIPDLPAGRYSLTASLSGLLVDNEEIDLPPSDLSISIELHNAGEQCGCLLRTGDIPPTIVYSGLVIDEDGRPLATVGVESDDAARPVRVFTAHDGTFSVEVSRAGAKDMLFSAPGYRTARLHVPCEEEADRIKVRMRRR